MIGDATNHPDPFVSAWFQDQDDAFARAIPLIYQALLAPKSEGDLYWAGLSADLFVGKTLLSAVAAYQWGQFRLYNDTASIHRDVSAFLADFSMGIIMNPC